MLVFFRAARQLGSIINPLPKDPISRGKGTRPPEEDTPKTPSTKIGLESLLKHLTALAQNSRVILSMSALRKLPWPAERIPSGWMTKERKNGQRKATSPPTPFPDIGNLESVKSLVVHAIVKKDVGNIRRS